MTRDLDRARRLLTEGIPKAEARVDLLRDRLARAVAKAHTNKPGGYYKDLADALGVSTSYIQVLVQKGNGTPSPSRVKETR